MSAKTDFIRDKIHKINDDYTRIASKAECDFSKEEYINGCYETLIIEWSRQLVLAEIEEWEDGSTPGFCYENI